MLQVQNAKFYVQRKTITCVSGIIIAISFHDLNHNNREEVIIRDIISRIHNVRLHKQRNKDNIAARGGRHLSLKVLFRDNKVYTRKGDGGGFAYS